MPKQRSLAAAGAALLAMLAIVLSGATPAQASTSFSRINVWNSSHCLDNATESSTKLQMWSCGSGSEQKWLVGADTQTQFFTFTNQHTGYCITAPAVGAGVITMQPCNAADRRQQWRVLFVDNPLSPPAGFYEVWQNVSSGLCMTTPSVGNGTLIRAADCDIDDQYDRWHTQ